MADAYAFGLVLLVTAVAVALAVSSNRLSASVRVPAPAIFLVFSALASDLWPGLGGLPIRQVERVVTVALVVILFDGGMNIGRRRFGTVAGPVVWIGVVGTFVTAAGAALAAHLVLGVGWRASALIGTALAPTDPAVVFSVLGRRRLSGRSGSLLEGESGANDPVGIALMIALLGAGGAGGVGTAGHVVVTFTEQIAIGAVVGVAGAVALLAVMRRVALPSEGLYPLRVLAGAVIIYGAATVAHGSGFLAVFTAGILVGDERAPYKGEIERFHSSLASLAEIVAFVVLGLSIDLGGLGDRRVWLSGLVLSVLLAVVVRPVLVGVLLLPVRLTRRERAFVSWAGLKGAVPILLGTLVLTSGVPGTERLYGVVFVVVAFSVVVQGGSVPAVARWCRIPVHVVEPEPWAIGVRLRHEPSGLRRYVLAPRAPADGKTIGELDLGEGAWITLVIRSGQLLPAAGSTVLRSGDEVVLLTDPAHPVEVAELFRPHRPGAGGTV
ncbi:MAG TPA: potassium/proton antiporter [Mycobacteriales bacterium]|nr:potassium/proton antiporter [Mycobacteriales bacterium]